MAMGNDNSESLTEEDEFTKQFRSSLKPRSRRIQPAIMLVILLLSSSIFSSYISDLPTLPVDGEDSPVGCNEDGTYDWEMSHPPTIGPAHFENGELTDSSFDPNLIWRIFTVTELLDSNTEKIESILNASILYSIDSNFSNDALVNSQSNVNSYLFFETNGRNINTYHTLSSMYCEADVISFHILRNHSETQTGGSSEGNGTATELAEGCNADGSVDWENTTSNQSYWYLPFPTVHIYTHYDGFNQTDYRTLPPVLYRNISYSNYTKNETMHDHRWYLYFDEFVQAEGRFDQAFKLFGVELNQGWNLSQHYPPSQYYQHLDDGTLAKYKLDFFEKWDYTIVEEEKDYSTNTVNLTIARNDFYIDPRNYPGPGFVLVAKENESTDVPDNFYIPKLTIYEIYERLKEEYCNTNIESFQLIDFQDNLGWWKEYGSVTDNPLYNEQLHLNSQLGGDTGLSQDWEDQNELSYSGENVVIRVIDTMFDIEHPDFPDLLSTFNMCTLSEDVEPQSAFDAAHGTFVTGLIGAKNNVIGGVGIAFDSDIEVVAIRNCVSDGIRMAFESNLGYNSGFYNRDETHIYSLSIGAAAQEYYPHSSYIEILDSFSDITTNGRIPPISYGGVDEGLGGIIVVAGGNGRESGDRTDYHILQSSRHSISVAATDENGVITDYSNPGASVFISAPGGTESEGLVSLDVDIDGICQAGFFVTATNSFSPLYYQEQQTDPVFFLEGDALTFLGIDGETYESSASSCENYFQEERNENPDAFTYNSNINNYPGPHYYEIRNVVSGYSEGGYTESADGVWGTSFSAPIVSGVIALILEANPYLTWRDVQQILIESATQTDPSSFSWQLNGGGNYVSHDYGFGLINAEAAIELAEDWINVMPEETYSVTKNERGSQTHWGTTNSNDGLRIHPPDVNFDYDWIPSGISSNLLNDGWIFSELQVDTQYKIESVELDISIDHNNFGELDLILVSPDGTYSTIFEQHDADNRGISGAFTLTSLQHWGEWSGGNWYLLIRDATQDTETAGYISDWGLTFYGIGPDEDSDSISDYVDKCVNWDEIGSSYTDTDQDGCQDQIELICLSDMFDDNSYPIDTDGSGLCDELDSDDDNDGIYDWDDDFSLDENEYVDFDEDGVGDCYEKQYFQSFGSSYPDQDNDCIYHPIQSWQILTGDYDLFHQNSNEWRDTDGDLIGDNSDFDDDGDGIPDEWDEYPRNPNTNLNSFPSGDVDGDGFDDLLVYWLTLGSDQTGNHVDCWLTGDSDGDNIIYVFDVDTQCVPIGYAGSWYEFISQFGKQILRYLNAYYYEKIDDNPESSNPTTIGEINWSDRIIPP